METGSTTGNTASSPEAGSDSSLLQEVGEKIMAGLKLNEEFHSSDCLAEICTDLRKTFRQR